MFAWFVWTGDNAMPAYLALCLESFALRAAAHVHVRLVRGADMERLLGGELHAAYEDLSLVHRADYLRCELLHRYGGLYADCDTICCSDLGEAVAALRGGCSAVLPDMALLHEAGMNVGLFRRGSGLTRCWRDALRARLDLRRSALREQRCDFPEGLSEDALQWNEILRDLVLPLVTAVAHLEPSRVDCGRGLRAKLWKPSCEQGFDPLTYRSGAAASPAEELGQWDVLVLTNNMYAGQLKALGRDEFLASGCALAEWLKQCCALVDARAG